MQGVTHIVIPRDRAKGHPQIPHQLGRVTKILLDVGAIDGDVSGVNDEIGLLVRDPRCERRPIERELRFAGAEMRVRDLNYPHASS
jgi:hypothetical protein